MSSKIYRTTSWYDGRVEIRPSLIQGGGMFARQPIQAGEIVAIVGGKEAILQAISPVSKRPVLREQSCVEDAPSSRSSP